MKLSMNWTGNVGSLGLSYLLSGSGYFFNGAVSHEAEVNIFVCCRDSRNLKGVYELIKRQAFSVFIEC